MQASSAWRNKARAFKFYTSINQCLKLCLFKLLSRLVENCRFWSTLKIADFFLCFSDAKLFVHAKLVWRNKARAFYTRVNQCLQLCLVKVLSRSVENCRFWSTLKIADFQFCSDAKHFVHASFVWKNWARAFKFDTRLNKCLKLCLVKVSSRLVKHCRFCSLWKMANISNSGEEMWLIIKRYYPLNICVCAEECHFIHWLCESQSKYSIWSKFLSIRFRISSMREQAVDE